MATRESLACNEDSAQPQNKTRELKKEITKPEIPSASRMTRASKAQRVPQRLQHDVEHFLQVVQPGEHKPPPPPPPHRKRLLPQMTFSLGAAGPCCPWDTAQLAALPP